MVASSSSEFGIGMLARIRGGCPPLPGITSAAEGFKQAACAAFNELVLSEIERLSKQDVVGVIISTRWMQGKALLQSGPASLDGELTPQLRNLDNSLRHTIDRLSRFGLKVLIFGPIPDQRYAGPSCVARRPPQQCSVPLLEQQAYRADVIRVLDAISKHNDRVRLADPLDQLCEVEDCPILMDGTVLYRDDDHLSAAGAMRLVSWFGPMSSGSQRVKSRLRETGSTRRSNVGAWRQLTMRIDACCEHPKNLERCDVSKATSQRNQPRNKRRTEGKGR